MSKQNQDIIAINPKDVTERKGFNTRYDMGDLRELSASIENNGFDPAFPLIVTKDLASDGKYILGAQGHRRLTVALDLQSKGKLKDDVVYAVLEREDLTDDERNLDIVRLNSGEPLPMLSVARVIKRSVDAAGGKHGIQAEIAASLGKSKPFVGDCLLLVEATKTVQQAIEKDKISAYNVVELIKELKDQEKVEAAVEKLISKAGDKKVTKKTKEAAEDDESAEDKATRLEEEKKAKEEEKAINKEINGYRKRALQFIEMAKKADIQLAEDRKLKPEDQKYSSVDAALVNMIFACASFLSHDGIEDAGGTLVRMTLSDFNSSAKAVKKAALETVKETAEELKADAKAAAEELKEKIKETKEQAAERIKEAKAKGAAKK